MFVLYLPIFGIELEMVSFIINDNGVLQQYFF